MKIIQKALWKLLELVDSNHGYSSPLQKRFSIGDNVRISFDKGENNPFPVGESVEIIETGRHDYLVRNLKGVQEIVYQFELME